MEKFTCDENSKAKVVLTDYGATILNNYHAYLNSLSTSIPRFRTDYCSHCEYESELWNIMKIFYSNSVYGTAKRFEKIVIL